MAVMGALTTIGTLLITIPIPATQGFFNLGDVMVQTTAFLFGPIIGGIAGGLGSGLADLLGGWYLYIIPTIIIKGTEGYVVGILAGDKENRTLPKTLIAWCVGGLIMVGGYFIFQSIWFGVSTAIVEITFNLGQMAGAFLAVPISYAIKDRLNL